MCQLKSIVWMSMGEAKSVPKSVFASSPHLYQLPPPPSQKKKKKWTQPLTQNLPGFFSKKLKNVIKTSDANLKGANNKKLDCENLPSIRRWSADESLLVPANC